jgi:hypothetical protein
MCIIIVTRHRVWVENWMYWPLLIHNYKQLLTSSLIYTIYKSSRWLVAASNKEDSSFLLTSYHQLLVPTHESVLVIFCWFPQHAKCCLFFTRGRLGLYQQNSRLLLALSSSVTDWLSFLGKLLLASPAVIFGRGLPWDPCSYSLSYGSEWVDIFGLEALFCRLLSPQLFLVLSCKDTVTLFYCREIGRSAV